MTIWTSETRFHPPHGTQCPRIGSEGQLPHQSRRGYVGRGLCLWMIRHTLTLAVVGHPPLPRPIHRPRVSYSWWATYQVLSQEIDNGCGRDGVLPWLCRMTGCDGAAANLSRWDRQLKGNDRRCAGKP